MSNESIAKIDISLSKQEEAIRKVICRGASEEEFCQFIEVFRHTHLNPYFKEMYWLPKIGPYVSHKGWLRIANRQPHLYDGMQTEVIYRSADGSYNQEGRGELYMARATVHRKDRKVPDVFEALYSEYKKSSPSWNQYPRLMLSMKAEKGALERAFEIPGVKKNVDLDDDSLPTYKAEVIVDSSSEPSTQKEIPEAEIANSGEERDIELIALRAHLWSLVGRIQREFRKDKTLDEVLKVAFNIQPETHYHTWIDRNKITDIENLRKAIDRCETFLRNEESKGKQTQPSTGPSK